MTSNVNLVGSSLLSREDVRVRLEVQSWEPFPPLLLVAFISLFCCGFCDCVFRSGPLSLAKSMYVYHNALGFTTMSEIWQK